MRPKIISKSVFALLAVLLLGALNLTPALAAGEEGADAPTETVGEETEEGGGAVLGVSTGTAMLVGAGLFTHVRGKLKEGKREQEYVHFENHTRPYDPETGKFRNE